MSAARRPASEKAAGRRGDLRPRILSGIVLAAGALAVTWAGGLAFRLFAALLAVLIFHEWAAITARSTPLGGRILAYMAMLLIAAIVALGTAPRLFFPILAVLLVVWLLYGWRRPAGGWLAAGLVYAGLAGACLTFLRTDESGGLAVLLLLYGIVWGTDIFAYFIGRRLGGPKLAPAISPGKTWSGAVGGAAGGLAVGLAVAAAAQAPLTPTLAGAILALSVFSQIGDLFESAIKRRFAVKDSGRLIPGHGGVMDRVDALVAAAFAMYLMFAAFGGPAAGGLFAF